MKGKTLIAIFILVLPASAFATPSSVDRVTDHIEPLIKTDYVKADHFAATSTTASSTLKNTEVTALKIGAQSGCATLSLGFLTGTGSNCATDTVGNWFTPLINYGSLMSATTSTLWAKAGIFASTTSIFENPVFQAQGGQLIFFNLFTPTATRTFTFPDASGIFCLVGQPCDGAGTVTAVTGVYPVQSTGGVTPAISLAFGTTTSNTWTGVQTFTNSPIFSTLGAGTVNSTGTGTLYNTGTSTATIGTGLSYSGTWGQFIGGASGTLTNTGVTSLLAGTGISISGATGDITISANAQGTIATTSTIAVPQLAYFTKTSGVTTLGSVATSSATCSGSVSCSPFTVVGSVSPTITSSALTTAITALGPAGQTQTGATQLIASSTNGTDFTVTASGNTQTFNLPIASALNTGKLSNTDWTTFNNKLSANQTITLSGAVTGSGSTAITTAFGTAGANTVLANGTGATAVPTFIATSTLFQNASAATTGLLTSTDWSTFNGKQAAGNYITALTGDVTASGPGSVAATLATVNSNVGTFTNSTITVNGKGLVTAASSGTAGLSTSLAKGNFIVGNDANVAQATTSIFISSTGFVGHATTTPWGLLSVNPDALGSGVPEFVIGSSTTTHLIVTGAGNVGIGTTTPYARLSVKGAGTTTGVNFQTTNSNNSPLLTVLDSGFVGIGTVSPNDTLQVTLSEGTGTKTGYSVRNLSATGAAGMQYYDETGGLAVFTGFVNSTKEFRYNNIATTPSFNFLTGSISRIYIASTGNVGISTTSPQSTLTVNGDIGTDGLPPVVSLCGTSPAITAGSTDTAGEVTEGTLATGCTITFRVAKARAPFCTTASESGLAFSFTESATAITVTNIGALSGTKIDFICLQNNQ